MPHNFPSPQQFFVEIPLYAEANFNVPPNDLAQLLTFRGKVDAFCVECKKEVPFEALQHLGFSPQPPHGWGIIPKSASFFKTFICGRVNSHSFHVAYILKDCNTVSPNVNGKLIKIGQYPSLADLSMPEIDGYRKTLGNEKFKEFRRSFELASHGYNIAAITYLRRIYESVLKKIKDEAKGNGIDVSDFEKLRMDEKINKLKDLLPSLMAEHLQIYRVLSLGVHELTEDECGEYFPILKDTMIYVLEDIRKKEENVNFSRKLKDDLSTITSKQQGKQSPAVT